MQEVVRKLQLCKPCPETCHEQDGKVYSLEGRRHDSIIKPCHSSNRINSLEPIEAGLVLESRYWLSLLLPFNSTFSFRPRKLFCQTFGLFVIIDHERSNRGRLH